MSIISSNTNTTAASSAASAASATVVKGFSHTIRKLSAKDVPKAAKTLLEAFEFDSLSNYLVSHITDDSRRKFFQLKIYECYLLQHINCGLVFGQNETTEIFETVSIWSTPESSKNGLESFNNLMESGYGQLWEMFDRNTINKVFYGMLPLLHNSFDRIISSDSRFRNKNIYTLVYVGSLKISQGKGNVRKLFQYMNENYIDKTGNNLTYLESSSPLNIPIYEKFGFHIVENILLGDNTKETSIVGKDYAIMNVMIRGSKGNDWTKDKKMINYNKNNSNNNNNNNNKL
ncbi:unnamed protein product [Candida verbasci]|uniref:N-acetyltransferase domain-containing protein n=1 Tax=Candida verbasci TaxID=1227364 RepID=A0A9W4U1Z2_9ASCO|nr:unnamed protein product [Candida verbasci]